MGCLINAVADPSNFTLSAANSWCALSFVLSENKYLSEVRGFCNGVLGSMGVNDATCTIYSDLWGAPGVALQSSNTISTTLATGFRSWTGFSLSITAGVKYWAVWKNVNGTPGTNNYIIGSNSNAGMQYFGTGIYWMFCRGTTSDGGLTWAVGSNYVSLRLGFTDGTYAGNPIGGNQSNANIFGPNQAGSKFTVPANCSPNMRGIAFYFGSRNGVSSGRLLMDLWSGSSGAPQRVRTTQPIAPTNPAVSGWAAAYFDPAPGDVAPGVVTLTPGAVYRVTARDIDGDNSLNCYRVGQNAIDTDANSLPLFPMDGTCRSTSTTDGINFVENNALMSPFALLLDTNGAFASTGGGGTSVFGSGKRLYRILTQAPARRIFLPLPAAPASPIPTPPRRIVARTYYPRLFNRFVPLPASPSPAIFATRIRLMQRMTVIQRSRLLALPIASGGLIERPARRIQSRAYYPRARPRFVPLPVAPSPIVFITRTRLVQRMVFRNAVKVLPIPSQTITIYVPLAGKVRQVRSVVEIRRRQMAVLQSVNITQTVMVKKIQQVR